ncbi:YmfQ family protein [Thermoanaerobacterium sp. CMT5567-10]|uniref:YmfQ family protein n=1 Tax=Thermoanaerobacterium sp. CMT5567-10 TaxID=3061989 RepID=UPI0026E0BE94|nr:YmfQ family protein [Thermoanaerobacterium sp. CMT5567-10]WKV08209.1 YmfQ family protein [Thermoanaerobacterium sp. CMT5567-10]
MISQRMMNYLPRYYLTSKVINSIIEAEGAEFDKLKAALDDILNQFFVDTATWGLEKWEDELGIKTQPDQSYNDRRAKIISKIRGSGICTIGLVKNVAESYDYGKVNVIEDIPNYTVIISFVDATGIPPVLNDIQNAIREILPAHLDIQYKFNYFVWDELDKKQWTWDQLDALNLTFDKLEVYK